MKNVTLTADIEVIITDLANQLHVPETEIIRQAIDAYAKKIRKKNRLLSFAGILSEAEADAILKVIRDNRVNKTMEFKL